MSYSSRREDLMQERTLVLHCSVSTLMPNSSVSFDVMSAQPPLTLALLVESANKAANVSVLHVAAR